MLRAYFQETLIEAGLDEAGRGCLAGPVYAAAVILPRSFAHPLLNDSKQLTEKERYELRPVIEAEAIAWAVGFLEPEQIDEINILRAAFRSMHLAVEKLSVVPELLLVDGNRFTPYAFIPHQCIVQGDAQYASIAAASVLAKTYRDDHMNRLHEDFPHYGWGKNKGYATREHQEALNLHGPCVHHRRSFRLDYSVPDAAAALGE
ncbi:ribonuclease HII [Flaviaesturariibacter flavus]|uniref:Ribonuclease HII n=1 Tax=Flaviaesturariibacter flavus TaxID=2502780 RepID=A0A4R1B7Q2_9BACT|nr:ribonuclease HII [Flaviaesturariibacter flavus]TCJ13137.1 ribonuclease HII [Flaviaesturariibacter flavus]